MVFDVISTNGLYTDVCIRICTNASAHSLDVLCYAFRI